MRYRREIDGLRAIAVLPVILFHGGVDYFKGGFIGVDIFFVISGYLITGIIIEETNKGTFSIRNFYERRARRILPALIFITICTIPFALSWMFPEQQEDYFKSVISVFLFLSNIYFWRESNYFAADSEEKPMLHTWSLAVEEQYYILFPIFILIMWRFGYLNLLVSIILATIISLLLSEYFSRTSPGANFYLAPTRAWELLAGSLCALVQFRYGQSRNETLGSLGILLIAVGLFWIDDSMRFPSLVALLPVGGVVLIILFADTGTFAARVLSNRILVGIGLVSYSAYLWHQPLFAFARIRSLYDPSPALMLALSMLALGLAYLSWRFVETPFRRRKKTRSSNRDVLIAAGVATACMLIVGVVGLKKDRLLSGMVAEAAVSKFLDEQLAPNWGLHADCAEGMFKSPNCRSGDNPEIAIWGDSFAMHLVEGVVASNPEADVIQMTLPRCGPFLDTAPYSNNLGRPWSEKCIAFNAEVFEWLENNQSVRYVVLSSPFRAYVSEDWSVLHDGTIRTSSIPLAVELFEDTLQRIKALGKTPVVFSPTPQSGRNIGRCLATAAWLDIAPEACNFEYDELAHISLATEVFLKEISQQFKVVWLSDGICNGSTCSVTIGENFLYFDTAHLTRNGSRELGKKMEFYDLINDHPDAAGTE